MKVAGVSLVFVLAGLALVGYSYVGYPLLLMLLGRFRRVAGPRPEPTSWPLVSITIPVYNEAVNIAATLEQVLQLDYPADRRQIVVVSDASSDGTDEIVSRFAERAIELVRLPQRKGKTAAENAVRGLLHGEIVVNTDASVRIAPGGLKALIAAFADPSVGVASGRDVSVTRTDNAANRGESSYVGYEMWVRHLETQVFGVVGASGCFYAIRKDLHMHPVPEALSRDFAAALIARQYGFRAVSVPDAICYVPRAPSLRSEYRRKVRTMTRGLETLWYMRCLLNPFRYGLFAWLLFSHKLCRWLVPPALLLMTAGLAGLSVPHRWAQWVLAAEGLSAALGAIGWLSPGLWRAPNGLSLAAYVVAGTVASLHAWIKALRGELDPVWEPTRREGISVH